MHVLRHGRADDIAEDLSLLSRRIKSNDIRERSLCTAALAIRAATHEIEPHGGLAVLPRQVRVLSVFFTLLGTGAAWSQSSPGDKTITLGFDGVPDLSLEINDFGLSFSGAQVLACGGSLNCGPFPPFSGKNVIYDQPAGGGVIRASFDAKVVGSVDLVSARVTGNRSVTMTAFNSAGVVLGSKSTGGANFVGSLTGLPPNILLKIEVIGDSIASVSFRDSGNTYTVDDFTFRTSQRTVVLDPGHGQIESGSILQYQRPPSPTFGLYEDNLTLLIANATLSELAADGTTVLLTRTTNLAPFAPPGCKVPCFADITKRVRWAEKQEPDLMVSIHTNAADNSTANGAESFYSDLAPGPESESLSRDVLARIVGLGLRNRGVMRNSFNILNSPLMPSTLIEVAFHSNSRLAAGQVVTDEERLNTGAFRTSAGVAIANAIRDFYATH
jgi:N-acetylmuramoyl-L-alanine amidase